MKQIESRKGIIYHIKEQVNYSPFSTKLDQALFEVSVGEIENEPESKFLIKKLSTPTNLLPDHLNFICEFNKLCTNRSETNLLKLLDIEEKDNRIYLIQEYKNIPRLTLDDQIKEVNIVNIIREIAKIYSDMPDVIMQALGNKELCMNALLVSNILYDPKDYSVMVDLLNYNFNYDERMYLKPEEGCIHIRNMGELILQLLYKKSKGTQKLDDFFKEQASLENGVQITGVMKNLIRALFSKNPPKWEQLFNHPLLNPLEGDYELWKNDFTEDEEGFEIESKGDEEEKYREIKQHLMAFDDLNDVRVILMTSNVVESAVRLLLFLILKSIFIIEKFVSSFDNGEKEKKKKLFLHQIKLQSKELKNYYAKALKKDFDEVLKKNSNELFSKPNEIDLNFSVSVENQKEWILKLHGQVQEDVEKVFEFLKEKGFMLEMEKNKYIDFIKI